MAWFPTLSSITLLHWACTLGPSAGHLETEYFPPLAQVFWNGRCKLWPSMTWKRDWSLKKGKSRGLPMFVPGRRPQAPGDPCILITNEKGVGSLFCINYPKWFRELVTKGDLSNIVAKSSLGLFQLLWGPVMRESGGCKQRAELLQTWPYGELLCPSQTADTEGGHFLWLHSLALC